MDLGPERIVSMYFVRYLDPIRKKRFTTSWRMTEEEAAKRFAGQAYEILRSTEVKRRVGGDWRADSISAFLNKRD